MCLADKYNKVTAPYLKEVEPETRRNYLQVSVHKTSASLKIINLLLGSMLWIPKNPQKKQFIVSQGLIYMPTHLRST